ncbi:MAG: polymerase X family protein, partial [Parcubacteria group bacterium GW2011_GWA1_42_7]
RQKLKGREGVKKVEAAGSLRRMKETVGDLDILAVSENPEKLMEYFCSMPEVEAVLAKGETKSSVRLVQGLDADLRIVSAESYGSALQYFTGSKDHGIKLRRIAQEKGLKLNEYGIFKGEKQIAGQSEEEVYETLGLKYINPEIREDAGEIEASRNNKLPKLVNYDEIKGDLQMHSTWSDGSASIREMAQAAKKIG